MQPYCEPKFANKMKVKKLFNWGEEDTIKVPIIVLMIISQYTELVYLPIKDCCLYIYKKFSWSKTNLPLFYCTPQTLRILCIVKAENI